MLVDWINNFCGFLPPNACAHLTIYPIFYPNILRICNHAIEQVDSANYFGIAITSNLSWSKNITKVIDTVICDRI